MTTSTMYNPGLDPRLKKKKTTINYISGTTGEMWIDWMLHNGTLLILLY